MAILALGRTNVTEVVHRINTAVKRLRIRELLSELSFQLVPLARTKTEEKYTPKRLHKALEKRVNKVMRR